MNNQIVFNSKQVKITKIGRHRYFVLDRDDRSFSGYYGQGSLKAYCRAKGISI